MNSDSLVLEPFGQECPPRRMTHHRPAHPSFPTHSRSGGLNRELQPQVDKTINIPIVIIYIYIILYVYIYIYIYTWVGGMVAEGPEIYIYIYIYMAVYIPPATLSHYMVLHIPEPTWTKLYIYIYIYIYKKTHVCIVVCPNSGKLN